MPFILDWSVRQSDDPYNPGYCICSDRACRQSPRSIRIDVGKEAMMNVSPFDSSDIEPKCVQPTLASVRSTGLMLLLLAATMVDADLLADEGHYAIASSNYMVELIDRDSDAEFGDDRERDDLDDFMDEDNEDIGEDDDQADEEDDVLGQDLDAKLPEVIGGRFIIPTLSVASTATQSIGNGSVPKGFRAGSARPIAALPESASERELVGQGNAWSWSTTHWTAANTYSNPRYFEDVMLERHGHQRWGHLQPLASGMRFFATVPMLPYKMAIKPACDCEYTMGYYRTGTCAPGLYQRPPWDRKAIIAESAAIATGMLVFP